MLSPPPSSPRESHPSDSEIRFKIRRLEKQLTNYKQKVDVLRKQNKNLKSANNSLKANLTKFLNTDQQQSLEKQSMRGSKWSDETLMKGYKLRLSCGTTGYEVIREIGQPLPSQRTLQRRIEHLKFCPGLLNEVLKVLYTKAKMMVDEEKHCAILIDEMAITPKLDFDPGTDMILGKPTIPSANKEFEKVATHGLVYMLAGVTTRWKQVVGYQFTGKSFSANAVKDDIDNIIFEAEHMGLKVEAIITDMAGQNQALWKLYNIRAGRHEVVKNYTTHPRDPARKLYFNPDPPHIFKNLRNVLTNDQTIIVPPFFVEKYLLPTNIVSIEHIKALAEIDSHHQLKLAPYLNDSCMKPGHYEKMKVGLAVRLLHNDTGAALQYCVEHNLLTDEVLTTAWFCKTMYKWFKLITSRTRTLALGTYDIDNYENAIQFLKEVIQLFETIEIGPSGIWKPVQTGVILATTNAIELAHYFITEKKFRFVCLGRFTQDALENLFSMVRFINPVPSPKYFKMALRIISVAQFFKPSKRGSYEIDDSTYLTDFLNTKDVEIFESEPIFIHEDNTDETLNPEEIQSLYYLTGWAVNQVVAHSNLKCGNCLSAIKTTPDDPSIRDYKRLTELKALSNKIVFPTRWMCTFPINNLINFKYFRVTFQLFEEVKIYLQ